MGSMGSVEGEGLQLPRIKTKKVEDNSSNAAQRMDVEDGEAVEPMSPIGRLFSEPTFNYQVLAIIGFKNPIDIPVFRDDIENYFARHKRFSSIVKKDKSGNLYWVRTQVRIDDHFIVPSLDQISVTESDNNINFVEEYAAQLMQAPLLDPSRPLWQIHVLNVKSSEAAASAIFRIHHSLGDGMSLISLLLACTRCVKNPDQLPIMRPTASKTEQNGSRDKHEERSLVRMLRPLQKLWKLLFVFWFTLLDIIHFLATAIWLEDSDTPIRPSSSAEFLPKRLVHTTVSLDDLQIVKKIVKGTLNDVILAMTSAGLTHYLQKRFASESCKKFHFDNDTKDEQIWKKLDIKLDSSLPRNLRLRAALIVNTRPAPGLHQISEMMQKGSQAPWGNDVGYVLFPMPIKHYDDPLTYVRKAKIIADRKKASLESLLTNAAGVYLTNIIGAKALAYFTRKVGSKCTMGLSNVLGPTVEVQWAGNPIVHISPTVYGHSASLSVHAQSYMGKLNIMVQAAKDLIPDAENLCKSFVNALEQMKSAAEGESAKDKSC